MKGVLTPTVPECFVRNCETRYLSHPVFCQRGEVRSDPPWKHHGGGAGEVEIGKAFQRVQLMEVAVVTRQMATLIRAGIPVVDALNACTDQTENPKLKTALTKIKQDVNEGTASAMLWMDTPRFSTGSLYVNMVRAGESSGTLDIIFGRLADFIEGQVKLKSKLFGTLMYPAIMLVVAFLIASLMMIFVVPKITEMFEELGAELPSLQGYDWNIGRFSFVLVVVGVGRNFRILAVSGNGRPRRWDEHAWMKSC